MDSSRVGGSAEVPVGSWDVPPAFSPRLRAADPILALEDTNGLYQAFRARRLRGRSAARRWVVENWLRLLLTTAGTLAVCINLKTVGWEMLARGILCGSAVVWALSRRARPGARRLPGWLSEVVAGPDFPPRAVLEEMRQMPVLGRDVIEAIYLEKRERQFVGALVAAALAAPGLPLLYAVMLEPPADRLLTNMAPMVLMALLPLQYFIFARGVPGARDAMHYTAAVVAAWQKEIDTGRWPDDGPNTPVGARDWMLLLLWPVYLTLGMSGRLVGGSPTLVREPVWIGSILAVVNVVIAFLLLRRLREGSPSLDELCTTNGVLYDQLLGRRMERARE